MTRETLLEKVYGESEEKIDDEYKEVVIEQFNESINLLIDLLYAQKKELENEGYNSVGEDVYDAICQVEDIQNAVNEVSEDESIKSYDFYTGEYKK